MRHDSEPPEIGDFGFYFPYETVLLTVTVLKASNFTAWPEAGGVWDQDSRIIRDVLTYLALERRIEFEQHEFDESKAPPGPSEEFDFGR